MPDDVVLTVNGLQYSGWESLDVLLNLQALAGKFELAVSERWADGITRRISPGDACTLQVAGETVITGYVDEVELEHDAQRHQVTVRGRDKTGDLVDCSMQGKDIQWKGQRLDQLASIWCYPYGIGVVVDTAVESMLRPHANWAIDESSTVFAELDRLAMQDGVLCTTDGMGNLLITKATAVGLSTALVLGQNILAARARYSMMERFSQYDVGGDISDQNGNRGFANAQASDNAVPRFRFLKLKLSDTGDQGFINARAAWERNFRIGKATQVEITVQGFSHAAGVWRPNWRTRVRHPDFGLDTDLLISAVRLRLDENGSTSQLTLVPPQALDRLAPPPKGPTWANQLEAQ